ncbi:hypothetical protein [Streptomyces spinosisporus]|jgi:hypothetical protein|uniref:Uncharacterized protein n=1 Tax=Streptomyces spinosisporus TaxID=2927582 RepID=A0ABS9X818_9ACTN|nr:hypothetical protein [Streptomyces spinosisporus]MCI3238217.1 hypothetical protein [Streptomyces spinosisporus]
MDIDAIKKRLRELRADPRRPGARAEAQRLLGEVTRARQKQDVADMQGPADRRTAHRQNSDHPVPKDHETRRDQPASEDPADGERTIRWGNDHVPKSWDQAVRARRSIWRP